MKITKRLFALLICAVMLATSCVFANAATASVTMSETGGHNITSGGEVVWTEYSVTGGNTGHTEEVNILEFNPEDGYMPLVFQRNAGSVNKLSSEYTGATTKYGYEVAGMINGSFFGMANSSLVGMIISNGRIMCTHNDYSDSVVALTPKAECTLLTASLNSSFISKVRNSRTLSVTSTSVLKPTVGQAVCSIITIPLAVLLLTLQTPVMKSFVKR